ncbi:uncharacterized protein LOC142356844 [Convolutriloba macropyga]|uniref:uncharacterized protein LOC142356844 n=1 Tax=Convolutriloba macropyga TaxID=536237 RepID=UPI003F523ACC
MSSTCSSNSDCVSGAQKCCYYRSTLTYKCCHIHEDEGNLFNLIWYSLGALFLVVICIGVIIGRCIKRKLQKNAGTGHDENKPENRRNCNQIRNANCGRSDGVGDRQISPPEYSASLPPPAYTENSLQIMPSENSPPYPIGPTNCYDSSLPTNSQSYPQIGFHAPVAACPIGFHVQSFSSHQPAFTAGQMTGGDATQMPPVEEMPPSYEQSSYGTNYGPLNNYGFVANSN